MKMKHQILTAAIATATALFSGPAARAQGTVIRLVASNGDRGPTQTAISKILAPDWTFFGIGGNATLGTVSIPVAANQGVWHGTFSGSEVTIKVNFSGALAGINALASRPKIAQRFSTRTGTETTGSFVDPTSAGAVLGTDYVLEEADLGLSTNFQSTSPFNGTYNGVNYIPLTEETVGVSALGFYASPGFPTTAANITTQQAQVLYTTGSISLFQFTGDFNDVNKRVWAIGRNTDAGQRFGAYTEIGLGVSGTVKVWLPDYSTAAGGTAQDSTTITGTVFGGVVGSHQLWPSNVQPGSIFSDLGDGGYGSGANLAPQLTTTLGVNAYRGRYLDEDNNPQFLFPDATAGYYIGYLTPGDALNRVLGQNGTLPEAYRGVALAYNGVPLHNAVNGTGATVNTANIQNGKYTAWLYNRLLREDTLTDSVRISFANSLRDQIRNTDATVGGGLKDDTSFHVKRTTDGGLVIPK